MQNFTDGIANFCGTARFICFIFESATYENGVQRQTVDSGENMCADNVAACCCTGTRYHGEKARVIGR